MHRTTAFFFLLLLLFVPYGSFSQQPRVPFPNDDTEQPVPPRIQKEMEKKANTQRQADLKRDAAKLLQLSTELKEYVDKSSENVLSIDVVRRAEEIEKLAHSVKVKMRGD